MRITNNKKGDKLSILVFLYLTYNVKTLIQINTLTSFPILKRPLDWRKQRAGATDNPIPLEKNSWVKFRNCGCRLSTGI